MAEIRGSVIIDTVTREMVIELPERAAAVLLRTDDFSKGDEPGGVVGRYRDIRVSLRRPRTLAR